LLLPPKLSSNALQLPHWPDSLSTSLRSPVLFCELPAAPFVPPCESVLVPTALLRLTRTTLRATLARSDRTDGRLLSLFTASASLAVPLPASLRSPPQIPQSLCQPRTTRRAILLRSDRTDGRILSLFTASASLRSPYLFSPRYRPETLRLGPAPA
jgi:hypothetical protein